jgi:hypothetical protein
VFWATGNYEDLSGARGDNGRVREGEFRGLRELVWSWALEGHLTKPLKGRSDFFLRFDNLSKAFYKHPNF